MNPPLNTKCATVTLGECDRSAGKALSFSPELETEENFGQLKWYNIINGDCWIRNASCSSYSYAMEKTVESIVYRTGEEGNGNMITLLDACRIAENQIHCKMQSYYETSNEYVFSFAKLHQPRYGGGYFKVNKVTGQMEVINIMDAPDDAEWKAIL